MTRFRSWIRPNRKPFLPPGWQASSAENPMPTGSARFRKRVGISIGAALILSATGVAAQVYLSNRCFTPRFWCFMQQAAPINSQCWCGSPYGYVEGRVR